MQSHSTNKPLPTGWKRIAWLYELLTTCLVLLTSVRATRERSLLSQAVLTCSIQTGKDTNAVPPTLLQTPLALILIRRATASQHPASSLSSDGKAEIWPTLLSIRSVGHPISSRVDAYRSQLGDAIGQVALKNSRFNKEVDLSGLSSARRLARKLFAALSDVYPPRSHLVVEDFYPYFRSTAEAVSILGIPWRKPSIERHFSMKRLASLTRTETVTFRSGKCGSLYSVSTANGKHWSLV